MDAQIIQMQQDEETLQYPITKPECVIDENNQNVLVLIEKSGKSRGIEVEYDSSSYEDIITAWDEGKRVSCLYYNKAYVLVKIANNIAYFSCTDETSVNIITCNQNNEWSENTVPVETTKNKITSISSNATHTQYPTAKAVYDAIGSGQGGGGGGTSGADNEIQRLIAGASANFIWEDVNGKKHYEIGNLPERNGIREIFKTTCKKVIAFSPPSTKNEWAFLFGGQSIQESGIVEEIYPYIMLPENITNLNFTFSGCPNIKDWSFINHLDVSHVTNMAGVFCRATADEIDLSSWNMSNVTSLGNSGYGFFGGIKKVIGLDKWDVSNVTTFIALFVNSQITDFSGIKNWNVKKAKSFKGCFRLDQSISATEIDLSQWILTEDVNLTSFIYAPKIVRLGLCNIPKRAITDNLYLPAVTDIYMREDAKICASLTLSNSQYLTAESVKTILSHLANDPENPKNDDGSESTPTVTFNKNLYAGYTQEDQEAIDALRDAAIENGWDIVNMG